MQRQLSLSLNLATACFLATSGHAAIDTVASVTQVARLSGAEGSDSLNPTHLVGIGGVDLGHMVNVGERTYFLFGDSFETELSYRPEVPGSGGGWRWNTMAWTTDDEPADGITFAGWITDEQGRAREIVRDERNSPITNIPTGGIAVGGRLYVWYMSMKDWTDPWKNHFSGLVRSDDGGETFQIVSGFQFPSNEQGGNFGMVAAARRDDLPPGADDHVYVWGTPANRFGGVKLARVAPDQVDNLSQYQYFGGLVGGQPTWIAGEFAAPRIIPPQIGEMSVLYNRWAGRWLLLASKRLPGTPTWDVGNIVVFQSPTPWGPWSEPLVLATQNDFDGLLYAPYGNARYVENEGESIYFSLSKWTPYDVFWMKATFTRKSPSFLSVE